MRASFAHCSIRSIFHPYYSTWMHKPTCIVPKPFCTTLSSFNVFRVSYIDVKMRVCWCRDPKMAIRSVYKKYRWCLEAILRYFWNPTWEIEPDRNLKFITSTVTLLNTFAQPWNKLHIDKVLDLLIALRTCILHSHFVSNQHRTKILQWESLRHARLGIQRSAISNSKAKRSPTCPIV